MKAAASRAVVHLRWCESQPKQLRVGDDAVLAARQRKKLRLPSAMVELP